jgi:hypothetical protein
MRLKGVFEIFLVLVLLSVGVWFVVGTGSSFNTPASEEFLKGNYTITVNYNSAFTNVSNLTVYNTSLSTYFVYNSNTTISTFLYPYTNGTSFTFVLNTNTNFTGTDGNKTITIMISNDTGVSHDEYINISFSVDNTPPSSLILVTPSLNQTFINDATIQFGFNVTDSMSGNSSSPGNLLNCSLFVDDVSIDDSIQIANATSELSDGLGDGTYYINVTSTTFDQGYHTWNVTCYDKNNNFNSSGEWVTGEVQAVGVRYGNFTLTDTVGPTTGTPTFSASSVVQNVAITITCTGTDSITANPIEMVSVRAPNGEWQNGIGSSPYSFTGTSIIGTYSARCYSVDTAGNGVDSYGTEATFAVTKSAGSSQTGGGSSGGTAGPTVTVNAFAGQTVGLGNIDNGQGIINAYQTSVVTFSIGTSSGASDQHSIKFDSVNYIGKEVTITISSDPITITMAEGDVKTVDVDNDGTEDIEVTLNSIDENGKVNMNIKDLITTAAGEEGTTTPTVGGETGAAGGMAWYWWVIILIVIVVIIALVLPKKKR